MWNFRCNFILMNNISTLIWQSFDMGKKGSLIPLFIRKSKEQHESQAATKWWCWDSFLELMTNASGYCHWFDIKDAISAPSFRYIRNSHFSDKPFQCEKCSFQTDRDWNSTMNIFIKRLYSFCPFLPRKIWVSLSLRTLDQVKF